MKIVFLWNEIDNNNMYPLIVMIIDIKKILMRIVLPMIVTIFGLEGGLPTDWPDHSISQIHQQQRTKSKPRQSASWKN